MVAMVSARVTILVFIVPIFEEAVLFDRDWIIEFRRSEPPLVRVEASRTWEERQEQGHLCVWLECCFKVRVELVHPHDFL